MFLAILEKKVSKFWLVYHGTKSVTRESERFPHAEVFDDVDDAISRLKEIQEIHVENHIHDGYVYLEETVLGEKRSIDYIRLYM